MKKGFFPHLYNTVENQEIILEHLPDQSYYDPDGMSKDRQAEFLDWYEKNKDQTFNFQQEMKQNCISDVHILLKACWKFRELLRKETGEESSVMDPEDLTISIVLENDVDPFSFLTIALVCLGIFRAKFLPEYWAVLTLNKANPSCNHECSCKCEWTQARKLNSQVLLRYCLMICGFHVLM